MKLRARADDTDSRTLVAAVVGIDGCGKTSTVLDASERLAQSVSVAALGDVVLSGGPDSGIRERDDIPLSRSARAVGAVAKGLRQPNLYKNLKLLEFTERTHVRNHLLAHEPPAVLLCDSDPLVNLNAWAAARYLRDALAGDDTRLCDMLHFMAGTRRIPVRELPYYARHVWQLALANRLHLTKFPFPDLVFLLQISPSTSMERIIARGRPLQTHENEPFLAELATAYDRVCGLLASECGIKVVRVPVGRLTHEEAVDRVVQEVLVDLEARPRTEARGPFSRDAIEVVATTVSGSFEDQRKLVRIEPAFRAVMDRPVHVHLADDHREAQAIAHEIVEGGGRIVVSAGGAGTFNAVLEGCHLEDGVPADLRLAFLRKGSADLIGKVLHVPDDLPGAAAGISLGIEAAREIPADILEVATVEPDGRTQVRHLVGFGGIGVFGDVPKFTEGRLIKLYKGVLGTLLGDLGPFYVGLALAGISWSVRRLLGRIPPMVLTLDGEIFEAEQWLSVIVLNGDLGKDFPLGRGVALGNGSFRVVALHHRGVRAMLRQVGASRTGALLDDPGRYDAVVREVGTLEARPIGRATPFMVNVDGLRLETRGTVHIRVSGRTSLVDAGEDAAASALSRG